MFKLSIRTKLVFYILLTIIITFVAFGSWKLRSESKQWEAYQIEQTLTFTSFTSKEIVKFFGRDIKSREIEPVFDDNMRELLKFNKDMIKFFIVNVNRSNVYESEFYDDFLDNDERKELNEKVKQIDPDAFKSDKQNYKIISLSSGEKIIDVLTPVIHITGRHILDVRFLVSFNSVKKKFDIIKKDYYIATLLTLCFSLLLIILISKRITDPIFSLMKIVKKMKHGDYNMRVKKTTSDEIGMLSSAFNEMAAAIKEDREDIESKNIELLKANSELKELQQQLVSSARLAAIGELSAGISHEIDNPIGIILGFAEYIKSELDKDNPIRDDVDSIITESKRCRRILGGLLNFAKASPSFMQALDLNDIAKETISAISVQNLFKYINIVEDYDHNIPTIKLDRDKIKQVLINLLLNAAQAVTDKGEIIIITERITENDKSLIKLHVIDNGKGIRPEIMPKIFDPFFTTKALGKGTGLGLSICRKLIEEHGGTITVASEVGVGTTFTLTFPVMYHESTPKKNVTAD